MKIAVIVILLVTSALAVGVAYLIWGQLVPYVVGLIPDGDWNALLTVCVYVAVGFLGGVGLPILIVVLGFGLGIQFL